MYIRFYRLLIILIISALPLSLLGSSHSATSVPSTQMRVEKAKISKLGNSVSPKKLRKKSRRRPPIAEFFICLGASLGLAFLAILFSNISILSLILIIAAGAAFLAALLFLFQWAYYHW